MLFRPTLAVMALAAMLCGRSALLGQAEPNSSTPITLEQAERAAVANQPRMLAAQLRARSSMERVREARAGYQPTIAFNATGVRVADAGTSTAAGNITTSSISDRFAYGGNLAQMVTDFGRTSALVSSTRATADAQADIALRFSAFEIQVGGRAYHFKTSPGTDQYFTDTLDGAYVGIRYYLSKPTQ